MCKSLNSDVFSLIPFVITGDSVNKNGLILFTKAVTRFFLRWSVSDEDEHVVCTFISIKYESISIDSLKYLQLKSHHKYNFK